MLIDTHTHLYLDEFAPDKTAAIDRAVAAGVERMIFPNVDLSTISQMKELAAQRPNNIYMTMGLHPTEVNENWENDLAIIIQELDNNEYIAIGEIGIDLYWDKTYREEQIKALDIQFHHAVSRNLPVIIHSRDGLNEILQVMDNGVTPLGVFHSFGGAIEDVKKIRDRGDFYFGINGIVTFKNSKLKDVLPEIGIDRILLETDAPYLAPVPHRGKRNESAFIIHTAALVAQALGITLKDVEDITTANAKNLFGIN